MRIGAQMSTSGGLHKAFQRGEEVGCETIMIFTKSNRQWRAKEITQKDIEAYEDAQSTHTEITPVSVHASYLINLASPDKELFDKSYAALKVEVERAGLLGIPHLTFHPGNAVDGDEEAGLKRIAKGLKKLIKETKKTAPHTHICIETMPGQGSQLGYKFEHIATMIDKAGGDERLAVCLDTCHIFSAGYDIRTEDGYLQTMKAFDDIVGLERIKCFHFNDSKHDLGSRKDRHEHIGQGYIGETCFACFLQDPQWASHPAHLETPKRRKTDDGESIEMDPVNLETLRRLQEEMP